MKFEVISHEAWAIVARIVLTRDLRSQAARRWPLNELA
jgi:hypothetical protein